MNTKPDPLRNPLDPLRDTTEEARDLYRRFSEASDGHSVDAIKRAAMNMVINAIREAHPKRAGAQDSFDQIVTKARELLLDKHYDAAGGRRNVFPFDQRMEIPLNNFKPKFFQT